MAISSIFGLLRRTVQRFIARDTLQMGAALAYYTVFSLAPLVLIAISIAGIDVGEEAAQGRLVSEIEMAVGPTVATAIQETIKNARHSDGSTTASAVGIIILLFGASGVFVQLQSSLNAIWGIEPQTT